MVLQFARAAFNYRETIMNRSTHLEIDLCFLLALVISFICLLTVEMLGEVETQGFHIRQTQILYKDCFSFKEKYIKPSKDYLLVFVRKATQR